MSFCVLMYYPRYPHLLFGQYFIFFHFIFFRGAPTAYGSSQARGWVKAAAAGLHHSHSNTRSRSKLRLRPTPSSGQCSDRGQGSNRVLMVTSQVHYHWAMTGTPTSFDSLNTVFLRAKVFFYFDEVQFITLWVPCPRTLPSPMSWRYSPLPFSKCFIVLHFIFKSLIRSSRCGTVDNESD